MHDRLPTVVDGGGEWRRARVSRHCRADKEGSAETGQKRIATTLATKAGGEGMYRAGRGVVQRCRAYRRVMRGVGEEIRTRGPRKAGRRSS